MNQPARRGVAAFLVHAIAALAMLPAAARSGERLEAGAACEPASFKIAIDIGHYKANPGAIGATGVPEFTYNLDVAHAVLAALRDAGFNAAFLIGESGVPLRLEERTRIAKREGARLFLSLHHDSVQPGYLSSWMVDGRPQHFADRYHGYSIFISGKNPHEQQSEHFAVLLGEALRARGLTPSLHHAENIPGENRPLLDARLGLYRFDDLVVLKSAVMPAALLESGIIVNRSEEKTLRDGPYHKLVAAAAVEAVAKFCGAGGKGVRATSP
jgi:N-acetylmuramoyl-L-alanine amidase